MPNEAKFTPGPWNHDPMFPTSAWAEGHWIATANKEANAHLIAAAPELYAALKIHHEHCISHQADYHDNGADAVAYRATRNALAKACGE